MPVSPSKPPHHATDVHRHRATGPTRQLATEAHHHNGAKAHPLPRSAAEARAVVTAVLASSSRPRDDEVAMDALLATSELATNAILHGGGITAFDATITAEGLDVTIADKSEELPALSGEPGDDFPRLGGYGWAVIRRLAKIIQITVRPGGGKTLSVLLPLCTR
ncbi:ATP-binding protein [Streptomyces cavernae]|uniref:ATP-binding protein n=1 Tax=Streptomyces cavernae TaxID=2259034 RepID=UPI001EE49CFE|nr:ATP-binding protein [Streptomyces cavernae]